MAQHFKDLIVWQKAMDLVTAVYRATEKLPQHEIYSLTNQIRRAAVSIPSNIAEGQAHYSKAEFLHFLRHSAGSLAELETQLMLAERLGYASQEIVKILIEQTNEVGRLLNASSISEELKHLSEHNWSASSGELLSILATEYWLPGTA